MPTLNMPRTGRSVVALAPPNRIYSFVSPVDCWISISSNPAGDAAANHRSARLTAGFPYEFVAVTPELFLSGQTTDANGDVVNVALTYTNVRPGP